MTAFQMPSTIKEKATKLGKIHIKSTYSDIFHKTKHSKRFCIHLKDIFKLNTIFEQMHSATKRTSRKY